jgi:diguanylate cyclase (GGDEF)-like protein/PAS domain S-box-containing protein
VDSDDFLFLDDDEPSSIDSGGEDAVDRWSVLLVDDDEEVHRLTRLVLRDFTYDGRRLEFLSAHSAREAKGILGENQDIAVVLLDVVMESEDAGLRLAQAIREELGNTRIRIVLRTGQPGQAPEQEVIQRYDINDYRSKTELTEARLVSTMVSSLRAFQQIEALERGWRELAEAKAALEEQVEARTRELRESEHRLRSILDAALLPILVCCEHGEDLYFLNDRAGEMLGLSRPEARARGLRDLWVDPRDRDRVMRLARERGRIPDWECRLRGDGGREFWALVSAMSMSYEDKAAVFLSVTDITARKMMEEDLKRLALTDPLTGVGNRRMLLDRGGEEVRRTRRDGGALTAIMIDLDHFKAVNDTLGHAAGDQILKGVAATVAGLLRDVDIFARMGGEEFAILLPSTLAADGVGVAERVREACAAKRFHGLGADGAVTVTVSLGVATLYPNDGGVEDLLIRADEALYRAKHAGRNRVEFQDA